MLSARDPVTCVGCGLGTTETGLNPCKPLLITSNADPTLRPVFFLPGFDKMNEQTCMVCCTASTIWRNGNLEPSLLS